MNRVLVLRAPGINCDRETAYACRLVGFETDVLHINKLIKAPESLLNYTLLVIPGGFSYGDDLGAGTLLAKNLTIHLGSQLQRFIDEERLVLGICNGFQVLVRAGLLPGHVSHTTNPVSGNAMASLTGNASAQFECRWVTLGVETSICLFTQRIKHPLELPVAHGEGQFVLADTDLLAQLQKNGQIPLVYIAPIEQGVTHATRLTYPANPNGSIGNIAGVCNAQGNVLGLMPHPERYVSAMQHPRRRGTSVGEGGEADGLLLFKNAYEYTKTMFDRRQYFVPGHTSPGQDKGAVRPAAMQTSYATSGVDISAANHARELMKDAIQATQGPGVLAGMGAFAAMIDARSIQQMRQPALVASTDGVGTKTLIAAQAGRFTTIGHDLVNHSVNDLLTQGARPLFFMDYLAMGKLDALQAATIVRGVAEACRSVGCALLGGETAEMPDVYLPGAFDLAGTIVGVVERDAANDGSAISPGDVLLGLHSSGLHTNGYSLARRVFAPYALDTVFPELGEPLVDALLRPHRCYLPEILTLQEHEDITIKGIAHITGGSFTGNIGRILPEGAQAVVETRAWLAPSLFQLLARLGQVERAELYQTLNMGIGMVLVFSVEAAERARHVLPELLPVGYLREGNGVVLLFDQREQ